MLSDRLDQRLAEKPGLSDARLFHRTRYALGKKIDHAAFVLMRRRGGMVGIARVRVVMTMMVMVRTIGRLTGSVQLRMQLRTHARRAEHQDERNTQQCDHALKRARH